MRISDWSSDVCSSDLLADGIAYDNHDIDDGLRAGLFTLEDLLTVPFVASSWDAVRSRFPQAEPKRLVLELTREMIGHMVNNLISESSDLIERSGEIGRAHV